MKSLFVRYVRDRFGNPMKVFVIDGVFNDKSRNGFEFSLPDGE